LAALGAGGWVFRIAVRLSTAVLSNTNASELAFVAAWNDPFALLRSQMGRDVFRARRA
jgi:hypothetical protein